MIAAARRRVEKQGWQNVELRVSAAEDIVFEGDFDGVLLFAMHDVLTSGPALDNLLRALKPGGMLVAIGPVTAQGFPASLLNPLVRLIYRRFAVAQQDIDQPWHQLQARLPDLMVERHGPGILYLVHGRKASPWSRC